MVLPNVGAFVRLVYVVEKRCFAFGGEGRERESLGSDSWYNDSERAHDKNIDIIVLHATTEGRIEHNERYTDIPEPLAPTQTVRVMLQYSISR